MNRTAGRSSLALLLPTGLLAAVLLTAQPAVRAETIEFTARLDGAQADGCGGTGSAATGYGRWSLNTDTGEVTYYLTVDLEALEGSETGSHVHGPAEPCATPSVTGVVYTLPPGSPKVGSVTLSAVEQQEMIAGLHYANLHTTAWPGEEIRGQILPETIHSSYTVSPGRGTVPLSTVHRVALVNLLASQGRTAAARIGVRLAGGETFANWRSGRFDLAPGAGTETAFAVTIPLNGSVLGMNYFTLEVTDVTAAPFNHPPYQPSGQRSVLVREVLLTAPH